MTPIQPDRNAFLKEARSGVPVIPVWTEIIADGETPLTAYAKMGAKEPSFLLESAEQNDHVGNYSFLGFNARLTISAIGRNFTITRGQHSQTLESATDPFRELEKIMQSLRINHKPELPPFYGGAVGYLSYDAVRWFEPTIPPPPPDTIGAPDMFFMLASKVLIFDHRKRRLFIVSNAFTEDGDPGSIYENSIREIHDMLGRLSQKIAFPPLFTAELAAAPEPIAHSNTTSAEYFQIVEKSKQYIRAGDIFQIVPAQRFELPCHCHPISLYRILRFINPSPYMFCLRCTPDLSLVGSSPEVHVRLTGNLIEIRPIAGTRRRGTTPQEDAALANELISDPKERAEHLMLVDLARNDVGRIAEFGTVKVSEFMTIERYSHVMHIVSHVSGLINSRNNAFDVMRATFPAGTVSGSPKVRAMQIINELEKNKRCTYAGAVGYFGWDGNLDSCIALRTILLKNQTAFVQAGGGVVADSTPEGEYLESLNKAKAGLRAVALAELLKANSPFIISET